MLYIGAHIGVQASTLCTRTPFLRVDDAHDHACPFLSDPMFNAPQLLLTQLPAAATAAEGVYTWKPVQKPPVSLVSLSDEVSSPCYHFPTPRFHGHIHKRICLLHWTDPLTSRNLALLRKVTSVTVVSYCVCTYRSGQQT